MKRRIWPLQRRVMLAFSAFALLLAALYGLYVLVFMYVVEDAFFVATLEQEAQAQQRARAGSGHWITPRDAFVTVHARAEDFPADLSRGFREAPWRREFAGEQDRHYHLRAMRTPDGERAWLVAEVGRQLVVRPMRGQVLRLLAVTSGVMLLLALGVGYWLATKTTRPLSRLVKQVEGMSPERLPLGFAREFGDDDEAGVLARGLEDLARRVHDFTRRERDFTRDASHELRTPLAVIRGSAERLAAEPALSASGIEQVAHVRQSAWQLERTIATLLSMARESDAPDVPACVPLLPVLERVVVEQSLLLDGKPVEVDVDVPVDARIEAPAAVAHILLSNLVGNAFAHTHAGEVRIGLHGDWLRIANRGDMMPATDAQAPVSAQPGSSGLALGLSIVRRLCARYGLDVRMVSSDEAYRAELSLVRGPEA